VDGRDWLGALAFEEADLRAGLKDGGQVLGAFIVARSEDEFVVYMRSNWIRGRGFHIIRSWRGLSGDRTFKHLQSAWAFIRKFHFLGRVTIYPAGDVELRQFVGVAQEDLVASARMDGAAGLEVPAGTASPTHPSGAVPDDPPPASATLSDPATE